MAPKRRAPAPGSATKKGSRQSALAKENDISAATEASIKDVFYEFAPAKGNMSASNFKRALAALNVAPDTRSELQELLSAADPEDEGEIIYANFVAVAALKLNAQGEIDRQDEVREAFQLFLDMSGHSTRDRDEDRSDGNQQKITFSMLKKVAALLKEDIKDDAIRDMMSEANGGAGPEQGVDFDQFEEVMKRAGMFG